MLRPALPVLLGLLAAGLPACGDNDIEAPEDVLARLRALDGVTVEKLQTQAKPYAYYVLRFTQPVDHASPGGPTFQQRVSLLHRDLDAPMIALTSGYWDYYGDNLYELTELLAANQISIEHRYFGESRPDPADWAHLTIRQMADDQHRIISALRTIYPGAFVTTGGSKGGMTATYHRRFYPDDVDGTVPYVAPLSLGAPDPRYAGFLDTLGPPACRDAVRAVATEMLQNRRAALHAEAEALRAEGHGYTRIELGAALEASVVSLEWAFWQYFGVNFCTQVPSPGASDADLWTFLDRISPVTDNDDASIGRFEAYYHQAYAQLGYPDGGAAYLEPYLIYKDEDYDGALPAGIPAYDGGAAMQDIDLFVKSEGARMLFLYGEWDPWTGGKYELGGAADSLLLVQPQGTHGARLSRLPEGERARAFEKLRAWTGVQPALPQQRTALAPPPREPRIPPAMRRGLRARR
ncbi:MAG TPA: S28 family serine protease [Kofleriaceae bacterium]|nr:S28 family serine protease [Kofleriaceae bacterium]